MKYDEWFASFSRDKTQIVAPARTDDSVAHSIRRFRDASGTLWDTGLTYTGRVVLRQSATGEDWTNWTTLHDVEID